MTSVGAVTWDIDWLWSLPLIVMSVVIHVVGLMIIFREAVRIMSMRSFAAASPRCLSL